MPQVGGKKFPYTSKGVAAAKREATQMKNRAAAGKSRNAAVKKMEAVTAAIARTSPNSWGGETVKSNRVQSKGTAVTRGGGISSFRNVQASDALQGGRKKTRTPSTRMSRAKVDRPRKGKGF